MNTARWHVLALLGVLAACAHPPPGYFFPTTAKPYRVSVRDNPARETVTITILIGPRRSPVHACLFGIRDETESEEGRDAVVSDWERMKVFEETDVPSPASTWEVGGGGYDPNDSGEWSSWSEAERKTFYGVKVEVPYDDVRRYGPVFYLEADDFENPDIGNFPPGRCSSGGRNLVTYELHDLEPLHAKVLARYEESDEFKERQEAANRREQARIDRKKQIAEHLAEEVATGRCNAENQNFFQAYLVQAVPVIARAMEHSAVADIGPHRVIVATDEPATYTFRATLSGLHHVFVAGIEPAQIDEVRDGNGDPASVPSQYTAGFLTGGLPMEALVARAQAWQTISVTVRGHGCTLIFTINEVGG